MIENSGFPAMRERSYPALGPHGFHRVAYTEWGAEGEAPRTLICVHGLTRCGRDFDLLAEALCDSFRVVCPDVAGRGKSDWLEVKADYGIPLYVSNMAALLARLDVEPGGREVDWLGTSMGGLIGMMLAAQPNSPIRRLVLNDVGPFVPRAALMRIAEYAGRDPRFHSRADVVNYLKRVHAPFGPLSDEEWNHLATYSARADEKGGWRLNYDPGIAEPLRRRPLEDLDLWAQWERITCPVLVLRGAQSDVLSARTAGRMGENGAEIVEFAGVGHAPALMGRDQIDIVRAWLLEGRE